MASPRSTPRLRPSRWRDLGALDWLIAVAGGAVTGAREPLRFVTALGRHRRLFRSWFLYSAAMMPFGRLPRRDTELAILRVAHRTRCDYELAHHRPLARRAGLTSEQIEHVCSEQTAGWDARSTALLEAVDQVLEGIPLGDDAWLALAEHLDERQIIELCLLVGHYRAFAITLRTLGVEPEPRLR